ncbi:hypothetical protein KBY92_08675 [Synechococcus sp. Cruz CV-v-12]|nr:hypothetical protein [Synechococcus sp. Cruz CV-v-12]
MTGAHLAPLWIPIPTLNEAGELGCTLEGVRSLDPPTPEALLVNGDSCDGTWTMASTSQTD